MSENNILKGPEIENVRKDCTQSISYLQWTKFKSKIMKKKKKLYFEDAGKNAGKKNWSYLPK